MILHDLPANSKTDPRALEFVFCMKPLKHLKNLFCIPAIQTKAVIDKTYLEVFLSWIGQTRSRPADWLCGNFDPGYVTRVLKFYPVAQEVLKKIENLVLIAF